MTQQEIQEMNRNALSDAIKKTYAHVGNFILLGLTGRTGSGCSTAAKILGQDTASPIGDSAIYTSTNDRRKLGIIQKYTQSNWEPFYSIRVTTVITYFILDLEFFQFAEFLSTVIPSKSTDDIADKLSAFKIEYEKVHGLVKELKGMPENNKDEVKARSKCSIEVFFDVLPQFTEKLKESLQDMIGVDSYVLLYQEAGDNVRASGKADVKKFDANRIFFLPRVINKIIRALQYKHKEEDRENLFIVIDAIRNPYEAEYFKQRHAHFFLLPLIRRTPKDLPILEIAISCQMLKFKNWIKKNIQRKHQGLRCLFPRISSVA